MNYKVIKILFIKNNRELSLVRFNNILGILKKFDIKSNKQLRQFNYEKNVVLNNNWNFVPSIIDYGENYFISEYIDSKPNDPEKFQNYMSENIINEIVDKLLIIKKSDPIQGTGRRKWLVFSIAMAIYKLFPGVISLGTTFKVCYLLIIFWIQSMSCFRIKVRTKGDFTELNILVNKKVYFIDFAAFLNHGFLFEDATYIALHQDKPINELLWQELFLKNYYSKIKKEFKPLNKCYLSFWLIYASLALLNVRYDQNIIKAFRDKELKLQLSVKKQHLDFFLSAKNRNIYISKIIS